MLERFAINIRVVGIVRWKGHMAETAFFLFIYFAINFKNDSLAEIELFFYYFINEKKKPNAWQNSISLQWLHGVFKDRRHPKISIQCLSEISHVQFVNLMTLYFIRILPLSTFLSQYISYSLNILKQLKCKTNSLWHAVMKRSDKVRVMSIFIYNVSKPNTRF